MLRKQNRLRDSQQIRAVRQTGQSCRNRFLALSRLATGWPDSRFAFSVSRQLGNAVVRNRVKRRLREAVRQYLPRICGGWDILLIARLHAGQATYDQIERAVADVFQQSKLWLPSVTLASAGEDAGVERES